MVFFKKLAVSMAILALWFECASVSGDLFGHKVHVYIRNEIKNKIVNGHCKSKNDYIGPLTIPYMQNITWHFKVNFLGTTLFWCDLDWINDSKIDVVGSFKVYDFHRDRFACDDCIWAAREDGLHLIDDGDTADSPPFYPWAKSIRLLENTR
ncbi:hypothetical protein ACHQM5_027367 [Ranunculus cassubicifolius]